MATLLEVTDLKKYFKTPRGMLHAVDDVSFHIDERTTLGVVGESGCGKSTLGRTILHLLDSTGGTIQFQGEDITTHTKKEPPGTNTRELSQKRKTQISNYHQSLPVVTNHHPTRSRNF